MPFESLNGTQLYFTDTGGTGTPIVFRHGLLWSSRMFDARRPDVVRSLVLLETSDDCEIFAAQFPVVVGDENVATVPAKAERIQRAIPRARLVRIPRRDEDVTTATNY